MPSRLLGRGPLPVKEYEIYVPLSYNDGSAIEPRKFQQLQKRLVKEFEGLTFLPQPNQGIWKMGGVTYHDEIIIYRVQTAKVRSAPLMVDRPLPA